MRMFLLILGWSSIVGSFGDGAIGLFALWVIGSGGWTEIAMTVDTLLREYIEAIYWVKQVARYVLPPSIIDWLFGLPALAYFPARIIISCFIGWWALSSARKLVPSPRGGQSSRAAA